MKDASPDQRWMVIGPLSGTASLYNVSQSVDGSRHSLEPASNKVSVARPRQGPVKCIGELIFVSFAECFGATCHDARVPEVGHEVAHR